MGVGPYMIHKFTKRLPNFITVFCFFALKNLLKIIILTRLLKLQNNIICCLWHWMFVSFEIRDEISAKNNF